MDYSLTLTNWVSRLGSGDERAMGYVFSRYFDQLITLAMRKMHGLNQVSRTGEDIALSAIKSLYMGLQDNRIQINTEDDLWGCLFCITVRKATAEKRSEWAKKRGGNAWTYSGDARQDDDDEALFDTIAGEEPSPELALQLAENADELLSLFDEKSTQRQIISMKLQGLTTNQIAENLGLIPRTIFWHLEKIRERWEFWKGLEYLTDNIFDGVTTKRIAKMLEQKEDVVKSLLDRMAELWEAESSREESAGLKLIWNAPGTFGLQLERRDPFFIDLESRKQKIANRWLALGRSAWKNDLFKIWMGKKE